MAITSKRNNDRDTIDVMLECMSKFTEDWEEHMIVPCTICGGEAIETEVIDKDRWFKCCDCGIIFSRTIYYKTGFRR